MKVLINIIGIYHGDYMGRLEVMKRLRTAKKIGDINHIAFGFEKVSAQAGFPEKIPTDMMKMFEMYGITGARQVIEHSPKTYSLGKIDQGFIDIVTRLTMVEMCKKEGLKYTQLDSPDLLDGMDKKFGGKNLTNQELIKYEFPRITEMVKNVEKLVQGLPKEQDVLITLFVGMVHVPLLASALTESFKSKKEQNTSLCASILLSDDIFELCGCKESDKTANFINAGKNVLGRILGYVQEAFKSEKRFKEGYDKEQVLEILNGLSIIEVSEEQDKSLSVSKNFSEIINLASDFFGIKKAKDEVKKPPAVNREEVFLSAVSMVRKSSLSELEKLLKEQPWLAKYQDKDGNGLLHICTNSSAITRKVFKDQPDEKDQISQALSRRVEVAELLISRGADINTKNNFKTKEGKKIRAIPDGNGESAKEIIERLLEKPDLNPPDKDLAEKLSAKFKKKDKTPKKSVQAKESSALSQQVQEEAIYRD